MNKPKHKRDIVSCVFNEEIFNCQIILVAGIKPSEAVKLLETVYHIKGTEEWLKDNFIPAGLNIDNSDTSQVIYFPTKRPQAGSVIHEVMHLVLQHARKVGFDSNKLGSDEFFTYYLTFWVRQINAMLGLLRGEKSKDVLTPAARIKL